MALDDLATLSNLQSQQAQFFGNSAAELADPYGYRRRQTAADSFDRLLSNPGSMETSPFFKYLSDRSMAATRAGNAAGGFRNSGRGQLALQEAAQGSATKAFFPLAELLGKTSGALNPLSPAAAGFAMSGSNRSQDYASMGALAKSLASRQPADSTPWWMRGAEADYDRMLNGSGSTGLPTGGSGYSGGWAPSYIPSAGAGTGTMTSDYGTTEFRPLSSFQDYGATDPGAMAEQDYWGYE